VVLYIMKYDIRPDQAGAYARWASESAIPRIMAIPGLVEFRGYRPVTGRQQIAANYEFTDMAAWAAWIAHPDYQKLMAEFRSFATNVTAEVWGPSPVVPEPLRPKK
jgi:antibiotic biosynthesis monooxygenase (ABM) superfamily enzyme